MNRKHDIEEQTGWPEGERRRYRIDYRTRKNEDGSVWTQGSLEVIARNQEEAEEFALQIIQEANLLAEICECCDYTAELTGT